MEGCHRDYPNITHIAADGSVGGTRTGTGGVITHIAEDGSVGGTRLGHQIGGLAEGELLVDTNPPDPEWHALINYYWGNEWAARSVMFYLHDAAYFNPKHILKVRGGIRCE